MLDKRTDICDNTQSKRSSERITLMKITADFARLTGNKIKPMHGGGQPPLGGKDLTE
jgi:hypothetical protein